MYIAKDVMATEVVTLPPEATVGEAIELLLDRRISGAPVVDRAGNLLGIVSELQLMEVLYNPEFREEPLSSVMTTEVFSVEENTLLSDVANLLMLHRLRRVPVLRGGRLVGLVSRRDLLRYASQAGAEVAAFLDTIPAEL